MGDEKIRKIYGRSLFNGDEDNLDYYNFFYKSKFLEINLKKNDYLYIPKGWTHWIFTKENTVAFSYDLYIKNVNNNNHDNKLVKCMEKCIPFYNKCNDLQINYEQFILNNLNNKFYFSFSNNNNFTYTNIPFEKNIVTKKFDYLSNFYNKNDTDINIYCSANTLYRSSINKEYINFENQENIKIIPNFNNFKNYVDLDYHLETYFNFDKKTISQPHLDLTNSILYILDGEKKVFLSHPKNNIYHYITDFFGVSNYDYQTSS